MHDLQYLAPETHGHMASRRVYANAETFSDSSGLLWIGDLVHSQQDTGTFRVSFVELPRVIQHQLLGNSTTVALQLSGEMTWDERSMGSLPLHYRRGAT